MHGTCYRCARALNRFGQVKLFTPQPILRRTSFDLIFRVYTWFGVRALLKISTDDTQVSQSTDKWFQPALPHVTASAEATRVRSDNSPFGSFASTLMFAWWINSNMSEENSSQAFVLPLSERLRSWRQKATRPRIRHLRRYECACGSLGQSFSFKSGKDCIAYQDTVNPIVMSS